LNGLSEGGKRVHRALAIDPLPIPFVHLEHRRGRRRKLPSLTFGVGYLVKPSDPIGRKVLKMTFAVFQNERVQVNECADTVGKPVRDAGDHAAGVRMPAESDVGQFFPADEVDHVQNVRFEVDVPCEQMGALPEPRQRGRKNVVTL
jgi:hypothetical protein